jgi:hypothetical protein
MTSHFQHDGRPAILSAQTFGAIFVAAFIFLASEHASAQIKLTDPVGAVDDWFGYSVAISGDYAVVGAPRSSVLGSGVGKALVYHDDGTGWALQAYLFPPLYADEANFGYSVAIDGDYIVVGAPGLSNGLGGVPRAHVFARSFTTWPHQYTLLVLSGGSLGDRFGEAVAIDGSLAIIGAPSDSTNFVEYGVAYIFQRTLNSWGQIRRLAAPASGPDFRFGRSVDILGNRVAVGWLKVSNQNGGAYTYIDSGSGWLFEQTFQDPHFGTVSSAGSFGASVALTTDQLIIGCPSHEHYPSTGAVFIYQDYGGMSGLQLDDELLEVDSGGTVDRFGAAVAAEAGIFVATAPFADGSATLSGATHVYYQATSGAIQDLVTEYSPVPTSYQYFGGSVSISGACHIVGAPDSVVPGSSPGAAYVFCNPGSPSLLIDFEIICCVDIPDFTTGPVEGEISFENPSAAAAESLTYWVDLLRPGGVVESVIAPTDTVVDPGAILSVDASSEIFAGDPFGDYALVVYWIDGNGEHSVPLGFTVGSEVAVPSLGTVSFVVLAGLLMLSSLWMAHSRRG